MNIPAIGAKCSGTNLTLQKSASLLQKLGVRATNSLVGNKMGKYGHFCLVSMDTDLLNEVQKGKKKRVVTECN